MKINWKAKRRNATCRNHINAKNRLSRPRRPKTTSADRRRARLRYKYKLTVEQYESMVQAQDGKCKICEATFDMLVVDHNHGTGKVRGLLCRACNLGLGWLRDDPERAFAIKRYLEEAA